MEESCEISSHCKFVELNAMKVFVRSIYRPSCEEPDKEPGAKVTVETPAIPDLDVTALCL